MKSVPLWNLQKEAGGGVLTAGAIGKEPALSMKLTSAKVRALPVPGEALGMKLVVTIPALNEEKTIAQVIAGIPRDIPGVDETEVIVMNDGSTDRTADIAQRSGAIVVNLIGRPGLGYVFRTGLERAMRRGADIIVNIDGDGQFNAADISKLVQPLLEDRADFATCSRFANPAFRPEMPTVKYHGNRAVTRIINWVCGGTNFTDVSCGFRAFNREAAYRLTLFGRFTYTQECFIDLFSKGLRIVEVPLKVRGVREHGKSRVASNLWKYATNSLPIILRAMRDIQPLKFFGGISAILGILGVLTGGFVSLWYAIGDKQKAYRQRQNCLRNRPSHFAVHELDPGCRRAVHVGVPAVRAGIACGHARQASADHRRIALPGAPPNLFQPAHRQGHASQRRRTARHNGADASRFVDAACHEIDPRRASRSRSGTRVNSRP